MQFLELIMSSLKCKNSNLSQRIKSVCVCVCLWKEKGKTKSNLIHQKLSWRKQSEHKLRLKWSSWQICTKIKPIFKIYKHEIPPHGSDVCWLKCPFACVLLLLLKQPWYILQTFRVSKINISIKKLWDTFFTLSTKVYLASSCNFYECGKPRA